MSTAESLELREREYLEKTGVKVVHVEPGAEGKESSTIGEELRKFCAEFEEIGS